jgi:hypothetical protein
MDDYEPSALYQSRNEWTARLVTILTPLVIEGLKSIFDESHKLCQDNDEQEKYLLTFQNFITRIPHWNPAIIETETKRIVERSGCGYLGDLVTCTHIIQLKLLTAIRVGSKQKKIDIQVPKLEDFVHKMYIQVARKMYKNVYLFETDIPPLQIQKNHRELEIIVQECIMLTIRESIPVESILRAYMDETMEEQVTEEIKEEVIENPKAKVEKEIEEEIKKEIAKSLDEPTPTPTPTHSFESETFSDPEPKTLESEPPKDLAEKEHTPSITFSNVDLVQDFDGRVSEEPADMDGGRLKISDEEINLGSLDIHPIVEPSLDLSFPDLLTDVEVLG